MNGKKTGNQDDLRQFTPCELGKHVLQLHFQIDTSDIAKKKVLTYLI